MGGWPEPRARFAAGRAHPPLGGFHSHACHREGPRRESLPWPASHTCRPAYPGSPLLLHHLPLQALLHFLFLQRPVGLPACSRLFHTRLCCWALHSPCRSQLESFCSPTGGPRPAPGCLPCSDSAVSLPAAILRPTSQLQLFVGRTRGLLVCLVCSMPSPPAPPIFSSVWAEVLSTLSVHSPRSGQGGRVRSCGQKPPRMTFQEQIGVPSPPPTQSQNPAGEDTGVGAGLLFRSVEPADHTRATQRPPAGGLALGSLRKLAGAPHRHHCSRWPCDPHPARWPPGSQHPWTVLAWGWTRCLWPAAGGIGGHRPDTERSGYKAVLLRLSSWNWSCPPAKLEAGRGRTPLGAGVH